MESILLIGACSAVDVIGKMLTSCTCLNRGAWAKGEMDDASVVPVCDDSSPSSDSSRIRRSVHFSQTSTIGTLPKSTSSDSAATTSTSSTVSIDDNGLVGNHFDNYSSLPTNIQICGSPSSKNEFIEVKVTNFSCHPKPSPGDMKYPPEQQLRQRQRQHQRYELNDRQTQRHRFLGHTQRKRRVRKLLAEDIAHRQRRSEAGLDQERRRVT